MTDNRTTEKPNCDGCGFKKIHEIRHERRSKASKLAREEIVRCRDCKHYGCKWVSKEVAPYFKACYRLHAIEFMVEPDGFCAWAERRTNE